MAGFFLLSLAAGCATPAKNAQAPGTAEIWPLKIDASLYGTKANPPRPVTPPPVAVTAAATTTTVAPPPTAVPPTDNANAITTNAPEPAKTAPPTVTYSTQPQAVTPPVVIHTPPATLPVKTPAVKTIEAPLDMTALKLRLRETNGIGVFTKLSLKNQVDDLMQQFRTHYLGSKTASVASLRGPYDMLVMKVLAMLQDSDPPLAREISGSREAIWILLADPDKFNSIL